MADSIIEKIRKAAEARDKAITEEAKKGVCAPVANLLPNACVNHTMKWDLKNWKVMKNE